jgi:hypothetical protein
VAYEFGPFRLNEAGRLLTRGDEVIPLRPKTFDLLLLLVQNHGVVVAREELVKALWPHVFVEEAIYFLTVDDSSKQAAIKSFNLASGALTTMRRLEKPWGYGLAVSRDQRSLVYSEVDEAGSDLTLVINFH